MSPCLRRAGCRPVLRPNRTGAARDFFSQAALIQEKKVHPATAASAVVTARVVTKRCARKPCTASAAQCTRCIGPQANMHWRACSDSEDAGCWTERARDRSDIRKLLDEKTGFKVPETKLLLSGATNSCYGRYQISSVRQCRSNAVTKLRSSISKGRKHRANPRCSGHAIDRCRSSLTLL